MYFRRFAAGFYLLTGSLLFYEKLQNLRKNRKIVNSSESIYSSLLKRYGVQGWWPVLNPGTGCSVYSGGFPSGSRTMFEICIGAILTQNVAWKNVEKSLMQLKSSGLLSPRILHETENSVIAGLIRSSGYYNQKAIKIKSFLDWFRGYGYSFSRLQKLDTAVLRKELLSVRGIGPETADSILLYALNRKIFVVDAYTRRIFSRLGLVDPSCTYDDLQLFFHKKFHSDTAGYNEYHALIVAHGKEICKNRPLCTDCCLRSKCRYTSTEKHN